ncbi:MAG TPA: permease-like cell division protein FtsX [Candidatus Saccharimonadales bacterium]|nr:permease-like cell division protein FtsX [Candidatus Saccharimonadales bacterium]
MKFLGKEYKMINAKRIFSSGMTGFLRNSWLSSAAILVMTATLSVGLLTIISFVVYGKQVGRLADKVEIKIYLKTDVVEEKKDAFEAYIKSIEGVKNVDYKDENKALEEYKELNKDNPEAIKSLEIAGDTLELPASFSVKIDDFGDIDNIQQKIKSSEYNDLTETSEVSEDKLRATKNIANALSTIRKIGIFASIILGSVSVLIIVNTIRLAIFNRKDEIEIMRLIGANKSYIKGPFLVEAAAYGAVAGIFTFIIMRLTVFSLTQKSWAGDIAQDISFFTSNSILVGLLVILTGMLIGILSAQFAIRKYVKLKSV